MRVVLSHVGIRNIGFDAFERCFAPGFDNLDTYIIPYGMVTLGGALKARGFEVAYLDLRMVKGWEEVEAFLRDFKPTALGCGFQTPNREFAITLCGLAKSLGITTIVGGPHVSCVPQDAEGIESFDHIVVGEGDEALPRLLEAIGQGQQPPRLIHAEPLAEIESRPLPYLSSLYENVVKRKHCGFIVTSRGCPGRCKYCQPVQKTLYGRRIKMRSAANVLRELEYYRGELGVRKFFIMDDMFTVNRKRINEFTGLLHERGLDIEYDISARVDFFDQDMADRLAGSGCNLISFGFESGSDHKLGLMRKQTSREQNLTAGMIWKRTGRLLLANILAGIPGETEEDLAEDFSFIETLRPTMYYFNWMVPFPGAAYYDELLAADQLVTRDFNYYEMNTVHSTPLVKNVDYDMVRRWEKKFREAFLC
jgi:radical SAM superfamily enzyme YgiQ (UPF0313 family)